MAGLDCLYTAFLKAENRVGGGEGLVGIYGSMTQHGTCSIMGAMAEHAGLSKDSVLVDIGSGLCRPLLHATVEHGVQRTFGIELDAVKCQKALPFVRHAVNMMQAEGHTIPSMALPIVICASVEQMGSLDPATHAYAAWEGFPQSAKESIGHLFRCTQSLKAITIVQRSLRNQDPVEVMEELGFGAVECKAAALPVFMAGSGRKLNAYLFVKTQAAAAAEAEAGRNGPSLLTATPFDPEQVISELGRMSSAGDGGSPVSRNMSAGGGGPAHSHGLRPRKNSLASSSSTSQGRQGSAASEISQLDALALASPRPARPQPGEDEEPTPATRVSRAPLPRSKLPVDDASQASDQPLKAKKTTNTKQAAEVTSAKAVAVAATEQPAGTAARRSGRERKPAGTAGAE